MNFWIENFKNKINSLKIEATLGMNEQQKSAYWLCFYFMIVGIFGVFSSLYEELYIVTIGCIGLMAISEICSRKIKRDVEYANARRMEK